MTCHIVCLAGPEDKFSPTSGSRDEIIYVPFEFPGHKDTFQNSSPDVFARHGIAPSVAAGDLLNAAVAAYIADVRASRGTAFDGWTRDFVLHVAVRDENGWASGAKTLADLLSFLTGDRWAIEPRQAPKSYTPFQQEETTKEPLTARTVSLFSGGLDSFVGAIDEVERQGKILLVGHHSAGGGATSKSQSAALDSLRTRYPKERAPFVQLWISPPKVGSHASETTTRGRSIIFLGLGIAIADGLGAEALLVPENGLISLNVPLTNSRLGSFSTRTTHPHSMSLVRQLLLNLGIGVRLELPYRFRTKGEMIAQCANRQLLDQSIAGTMSCSHPGANRFTMKNPTLHCGYCIPCLIRRAAISSSLSNDPTPYAVTDLAQPLSGQRQSDLRALKMALDRFAQRPPRLSDLLASGPLRYPDNELAEYLGVFSRGLDEVRLFLTKYPSKA